MLAGAIRKGHMEYTRSSYVLRLVLIQNFGIFIGIFVMLANYYLSPTKYWISIIKFSSQPLGF